RDVCRHKPLPRHRTTKAILVSSRFSVVLKHSGGKMARKTNRRKTQSGAVGGPGTGGGLNFQVDFGVLHALEAISFALVNSLEQPEVAMEPRIVSGETHVTCWDVRTSYPNKVTEAKLKPKREEIPEW